FRYPCSALPVLLETEHRRRDGEALLRRGHGGEPLPLADRLGQLGAAQPVELRLVVEQVHLRRRARLEEVDDPLRLGREVRQPRQAAFGGRLTRAQPVLAEERCERGKADALEYAAASEEMSVFLDGVHGLPHSFVIASSRLRIIPATVAYAASSTT